MRPFLMTAAIAAALLTTTIGYAAPGRVDSVDRAGLHEGHRDRGRSHPDSMTDLDVFPVAPAAFHSMQQRPRLSHILAELGRADQRITADRHHGTLTRAEARMAYNVDRAIRTAAMSIAARSGGALPPASYARLQQRVAGLDALIRREARA